MALPGDLPSSADFLRVASFGVSLLCRLRFVAAHAPIGLGDDDCYTTGQDHHNSQTLEKRHRSDSATSIRPAESQLTKSVAGRLGAEGGSTIQSRLSLRNLTRGVQPCRFFLTSEQHAAGESYP